MLLLIGLLTETEQSSANGQAVNRVSMKLAGNIVADGAHIT